MFKTKQHLFPPFSFPPLKTSDSKITNERKPVWASAQTEVVVPLVPSFFPFFFLFQNIFLKKKKKKKEKHKKSTRISTKQKTCQKGKKPKITKNGAKKWCPSETKDAIFSTSNFDACAGWFQFTPFLSFFYLLFSQQRWNKKDFNTPHGSMGRCTDLTLFLTVTLEVVI